MQIQLRLKLIVSFLFVVVLTGMFSTWVGVHFIGRGIIHQAQEKVRMDLNSAREIYREHMENVRIVVRLTAIRLFLKDDLIAGDLNPIKEELNKVKDRESIDILTLTDARGIVLYRTRNPGIFGDDQSDDEIIQRVKKERRVIASTEIIPSEKLMKEGADLVEQSRIRLIPTPQAKPRDELEETAGMMIKAAAPILDNRNNLIGILYGGILLNRNNTIVDKAKETVYGGQTYKGKELGTATIFQKDLRISTNVRREDGERAIGTRVSEEVYDQVLIKGLPWIERAFVVNDWYITAYEPIRNISGSIIGILYVGILEEKFSDLRSNTIWIFLGITLAGIFVAFGVSYLLALNILSPLKFLVFASKKLAEGEFTQKVPITSRDMIGELGKTFNSMVDSLRERDERIKNYTQQKIMESERLATVGQLAAGVAHELNNPLGGVLMYSHLLLENMKEDDPQRQNLEKIVTQANRCKGIVKGLLDFSRQTEPKMEPSEINELLNTALSLVENQAVFHNITVTKDLTPSLPAVMADGQQIQQVFINIFLNAAEAMKGKGNLSIHTKTADDENFVQVEITDTGCGIAEELIERLFEPFFTTKEVGRGTGLGLSISYGIIQGHGGTINVKSKVGKGTTFIIRFPLIQGTMEG